MHSRLYFGALVALLSIVAIGPARAAFAEDASKPHVAVVEFSNETGSSSYDAACRSATGTLVLTLRQLGAYSVQAERSPGRGEEALRAMAAERRLDFVMYGKLAKPGTGGIECSLSVFDRAKGKTALSRTEKATGVLDIFDATDALVVSVLEAMTGSHIGFGTVALKNTGEEGSYAVSLDGSPAGSDLRSLDKVLIGRRTIAITQRRMLGDREIARASVDVKEGESVELSFAVPLVTEDEKAKLESLTAAVKAGWNGDAGTEAADAAAAELASLLKDVAYSPKLSTYRDAAKQLSGEWALQKCRLQIELSAWDPKLELLDTGSAVYAGAKGYSDPARIRASFEENARLLETLFALKAGKSLGDGDLDSGFECFANALMISARYMGGSRLTDYAYAVTTLKSLQDMSSAGSAVTKDDRNLNAVFGDLIRAGQRFFSLKDKVAAGGAALVGSDFSKALAVDGADYADAPLALKKAAGPRSVGVQPKGEAKPIALAAAPKARLLFVQDGFAPFGKIAAVISGAPGAIDASASLGTYYLSDFASSIVCSLDGGDEVELPHLFENVAAGEHVIRIPDLRAGNKIYPGLEEKLVVEAGKRFTFYRRLNVGSGTLRVEKIPEGSTILVDGIEQEYQKSSSGDLFFEGAVDSGYSEVEVVNGNKKWYLLAVSVSNGEKRVFQVENMSRQFIVQRKTIKLKGKEEDWAGVEPIFRATDRTAPYKVNGSVIAGGTLCRDGKNLYVRIDFSNGKPATWGPECWRILQLYQGGYHVDLDFSIWGDGKAHTNMWEEKGRKNTECGSYAVGPSFIEMSFPLSWLPKYLDLAKPFSADLGFGDKKGFWCASPRQEISLAD